MPNAVTVVIPNWNGKQWLPGCLEGLEQQTLDSFDIVIVDNGSSDRSVEWIQQNAPHVHLLENRCNTGFAAAANAGIAAGETPFVALLNNDTIPSPGWLEALVNAMQADGSDRIGSAASCMVHYDNPATVENAGDQLTWQGEALKRGRGRSVDEYRNGCDVLSPCAGAALYRRSFLEETMPSPTYVRLVTRNRYWLFWKNVPAQLRKQHRGSLLYGSLCFPAIYRRPLAWIQGACQALKRKPEMLAFNRSLWANCRIDETRFEMLLEAQGTLPSFHRRDRGPNAQREESE
jgi:GT2 family glycosyltransferase